MLQGADGFWRMHAWLLARRGQFTDTQLTTSLPELGFDDVPAFLGAMHGKETLRTILTDVIEAQSRRIRTVPTILANQLKFEGRQAEAAVVRALAAGEGPVPPPARGTQKAQTPATIVLPDGFSREQLLAAVTATVRIEDPQGRAIGTGAVVGLRPPAAYVLTARHLVPEHSTVLVRTFSAESYPHPAGPPQPASIVARSQHADLAALRFAAPGSNPAILPIRPLPPDTNGERFPALSVGCKAGVPTAQAENVLGGKTIRVREDGPTMSVWEVEGEIAPGASGGPLVDQHGYILGIASGTGGGQGYFTDIHAIQQFLEEQGLDWLLRPRK